MPGYVKMLSRNLAPASFSLSLFFGLRLHICSTYGAVKQCFHRSDKVTQLRTFHLSQLAGTEERNVVSIKLRNSVSYFGDPNSYSG